jgi:hypothetical protein
MILLFGTWAIRADPLGGYSVGGTLPLPAREWLVHAEPQVTIQAAAQILEHNIREQRRVGIVGLGYMGLPLAASPEQASTPSTPVGPRRCGKPWTRTMSLIVQPGDREALSCRHGGDPRIRRLSGHHRRAGAADAGEAGTGGVDQLFLCL